MGEWEHLFSNHYTTGSLVIIAYNLVGVYLLPFKKKIVVNQIGSMIYIDDIHLKVWCSPGIEPRSLIAFTVKSDVGWESNLG